LFVFVYSTTLYGTHATFIYFKHRVRNYLSKIFDASITLCDAFTVFSIFIRIALLQPLKLSMK